MAQLKHVVEPFGEVNVYPGPNGGTRVWASILMEPRKEGAQTGIAIDGSGSMRKMFGQDTGGGVVSSIFAKPRLENHVSPVAQKLCAYLARTIDADGGTTCIYWAVGPNGSQVEVVGDLRAEQAETHNFKGPSDFGTGTLLLPAVKYFVERFKDAPWGFYIFITDGELFDLEEVKLYTKWLAKEIAGNRRNPVKFVLIGLGADANERQLEELDDLETGTEIDLWDHKMASEMRQLQDIFAEVVDRNARVAETGKILDPQGRVIRDFSDTGLPALLRFVMPAGAQYFTLEVNGQRIHQPLADNVATPAPVAPVIPTVTPVSPAPPVIPAVPVSPMMKQQTAPPMVSPAVPGMQPPAPPSIPKKPEKEWDKDPIDLQMEELAKSIDLEFADPSQPQSLDDLNLDKNDDSKKK
ncbi:MAG: VWA domain-containing protein [Planctomycetes bacterium]|nr:VWA domain-containing protein [Planctomycetota bacterium]